MNGSSVDDLPSPTSETVRPESLEPERTTPSSGSTRGGGYDPFFFDRLVQIEDQHFWFRARNRLILELARRISSTQRPGSLVLEVGCGTGNALRMLRKACPNGVVVGLDLWSDGLRHAQSRSAGLLVQGDVCNWPFRKPFDLIGLFDVIEHVPEERETLDSLWKSLAPGGKLLLTVPAHQFLWSYFDDAAHHCRRYSARDIRHKLTEAGFQVEFLSQFMACIFPMVWIFRKMRGLRKHSDSDSIRSRANDEFRLIPIVNQILTALLTLEARWLARGHHLPIGTSLVVVACRPA
jgi:SAM-dependent methyltransferase